LVLKSVGREVGTTLNEGITQVELETGKCPPEVVVKLNRWQSYCDAATPPHADMRLRLSWMKDERN